MKKGRIILVTIYFILFSNLSPTKGYKDEKIPVLMYHHLEENSDNNVVISRENFENQMKTLKEVDYNTITTQQLYHYLIGGIQLPKNQC